MHDDSRLPTAPGTEAPAHDLRAIVTAAVREAMVTPAASPWMDTRQAAAYLNVGIDVVHKLTGPSVKPGHGIPFHRLVPGGQKRLHRAELDEWLRTRGG